MNQSKSITSLIPQSHLLILGFGREGQSCLKYLLQHFSGLDLTIADQNPQTKKILKTNFPKAHQDIKVLSGQNYLNNLHQYQLIFKTPGIHPHHPQIKNLNPQKTLITSITQLFFEVCRGTIIGITGSKGKSTTASLIHHLLIKNNLPVQLVGNIGKPVLDHLGKNLPQTIYCLELSSFQLMDLTTSPHIAVIQDIFPEHLDYHQNFNEYLTAKQNITRFQKSTDHLIYNADSQTASQTASITKAQLHPFTQIFPQFLKPQDNPLPGKHNLYNLWPAIIIGQIYHLTKTQIRTAIKSFTPLTHRLQKVGHYHQLTFINDSAATNPEATIAAIAAFQNKIGTIILGGTDKNLDYSKLIKPLQKTSLQNIILFPPTGKKIAKILKPHLPQINFLPASSMRQAIKLAYQHTPPHTVCLLSAASPSFGLFKDYQDRGNQFAAWAKSHSLKAV